MIFFKNQTFIRIVSALFIAFSASTMVACASKDNRASAEEYVEDSVITTRVKAAILGEPDLKVLEINVETFKGTVQLSGFVSERGDIAKATEVARKVDGVVAVKNDIRVK
jgi:osmotically-inducible protein OsmY